MTRRPPFKVLKFLVYNSFLQLDPGYRLQTAEGSGFLNNFMRRSRGSGLGGGGIGTWDRSP